MYKASAGGGAAARSSHRHALVEAMTLFMAPRFSAERRWSAYHTTLAAVLMAWEDAATLGERFEVVRDFLARALPRRRKLGHTYQGLAKAVLRHGPGLVEEVRDHLRRESLARCPAWRLRLGFEAVTIDGSRFDAPRTVDNQSGLGTAGRAGTHPQMAATVAWHMGLGVPWTWRVGRADAGERTQLREMLDELPEGALLVMDAGFTGYDLSTQIRGSGRHFLLRVGSNVTLLTDGKPGETLRRHGGRVWLCHKQRDEPLPLRLIVVGEDRERVFLVTDVLDPGELSDAQAAELYAMRWGVEVFYRQAKQTMERRKVRSASAARALLELHWTLVAAWLLMLLNAAGLASRGVDPLRTSVAEAGRVVRRWMRRAGGSLRTLLREVARCVRDDTPRRCAKTSYRWPHKKRDPRPRPPRLHAATHAQVPVSQRQSTGP